MIERIEAQMRAIYGTRPWLVAGDVLQGAGATVRRLRELGAPRCFAIAARTGTGPLPSGDDCDWRVLDLPPMPMMDAIHASEDALRALPDEVQAAVDAFDPAHTLRVLGAIFSDGRPVAGRRFWGARPLAWRALEDKTTIDAVWDAAGVARVQAEVVDLELDALTAAAHRLDRGAGTVWAGDASRGFHGGATFTCRVRDAVDAERALAHLRTRCARARVMPFLDGIPCSIHGIVFPEHVVVLRPAEMVTLLHDGGTTGFLYARAATFWDPAPERREEMRRATRRVGAYLRASCGYRGAFTMDGVMTRDGFRPTELNPRVGAALGMMVRRPQRGSFPFELLHDALVEGVMVDTDPVALEAELLAFADGNRSGSFGFWTDERFTETVSRRLVWTGDSWRTAVGTEPSDGELAAGPGPTGGFVNLTLNADRTPIGPSVGPRAAALAAYTDSELGTRIGSVAPARPAEG